MKPHLKMFDLTAWPPPALVPPRFRFHYTGILANLDGCPDKEKMYLAYIPSESGDTYTPCLYFHSLATTGKIRFIPLSSLDQTDFNGQVCYFAHDLTATFEGFENFKCIMEEELLNSAYFDMVLTL